MSTFNKSPIWLHPSGNWCKKRLGKFYYFGHDREAALRLYAEQWPAILAGDTSQPVKAIADTLTVSQACNQFLAAKREAADAGQIGVRWYDDLIDACRLLSDHIGRDRPVVTLRPADFARLKLNAAQRYGPVALGNFVQRVRSLFKWCHDAELIDDPIRFGPDFSKPKKRLVRLNKADSTSKALTATEAVALIEAAPLTIREMIFLGLNCGFGQTDCAELPAAAIVGQWIDFRRPKTGAVRRCPLWPETVAALAEVPRRQPVNDSDAGLVFLTVNGLRYVRCKDHGINGGVRIDGISHEYAKLARKVGVSSTGFYTLRHVHRTIAGEAKDRDAAGLIMGHIDDSMAGNYVHAISDERLLAVTDKVHDWLFKQPLEPS